MPNGLDLQGMFQNAYDPTLKAFRVTNAGEAIGFNAEQFGGTSGAGGYAQYNANAGDTIPNHWLFDGTTAERVKGNFTPPPTWASFKVAIMVTNAGAGSGGLTWRYKHLPVVLGTNPSAAVTTFTALTFTAPAINHGGAEHQVFADTITITPGGFGEIPEYFWVIDRNPADAGDTLANDAALMYVNFLRMA